MNPVFKSKYDQMRESTPAEATGDSAAMAGNGDQYAEAGHIRNLCFVWPDGKRQFLNYSYLISGKYSPDENKIELEFTTHIVKLVGMNLEDLYQKIMLQVTMRIVCIETRYGALNPSNESMINEIEILENK